MIRVENVTRCFPVAGGGEVRAVDNLSFHVAAGEVFGLLGPNGAGKTTTLRIILGLLRPTAGQAAIGGWCAATVPDEVKRQVGLVSSSAALYQHLSVREMLLFCADLYQVPPRAARAELERLAHLLDFAEFIDRRCATLSTGQRQRVHLARAPHPPAARAAARRADVRSRRARQPSRRRVHRPRAPPRAKRYC